MDPLGRISYQEVYRSLNFGHSILLVAGDKAGNWNRWYDEAIPLAEARYELYLKERAMEEGGM